MPVGTRIGAHLFSSTSKKTKKKVALSLSLMYTNLSELPDRASPPPVTSGIRPQPHLNYAAIFLFVGWGTQILQPALPVLSKLNPPFFN
jgi:hypothetical protein